MPQTVATVSACLIVRNEAAFLEGCLESLMGMVDEIVVVDTGSTDTTTDIARAFGCKLVFHAWTNDFATARNCALDHASGDWILYIDADERLKADASVSLGKLLPEHAIAARVRFRPRTDATCYGEVRLFRRDPRIRFAGLIHETMLPAVLALVDQGVGEISDCFDIGIDHLGYEGDQSHKHARNIPLLRDAIAEAPERVYLHYHLGHTLHLIGANDKAAEHLQKGMQLALRETASEAAKVEGSMCALVQCSAEIEVGRYQQALDLSKKGLALFPGNLALQWAEARCLAGLGDLEGARQLLNRLLHLDAESFFDRRLAYAKTLFNEDIPALYASIVFRQGDYGTASALFERVLDTVPDSLEYRSKLALCRAQLSR